MKRMQIQILEQQLKPKMCMNIFMNVLLVRMAHTQRNGTLSLEEFTAIMWIRTKLLALKNPTLKLAVAYQTQEYHLQKTSKGIQFHLILAYKG